MKAVSLTKKFVPTFKDNDKAEVNDQLVATMSMPTVEDVFAIADRLSASGVGEGKTDSTSLTMARNTMIAKECGQYVPKYITLSGNEGFTVEDVVKYPPYFALAVELLFALVAFAQPNEADVKN